MSYKSVLVQIVTTTLILVLTHQFCYPYFYNSGDSIVHALFTTAIMSYGGLPPAELLPGYQNHYLFHTGSAITAFLTGIQSIHATYLTAAIPIIICGGVFVYLLANVLTKSNKAAVLSASCYLLTPIVLIYAVNSAPRTLATLAFLMLLYFFFRSRGNKSVVIVFLSVITAIYMILVHHAQHIFFLIIFTAILVFYWFFNHKFSRTQIQIVIVFLQN